MEKRAEVKGEVIPVVEETVRVGKRWVEAGKVRVRTRVVEREEVVDEPLVEEVMEVERVAVGKEVERWPAVRQEGETMVVPVVEEVVVVSKRLVVREEIRITRRRREVRRPVKVVVRREEVEVEREGEKRHGGT